MNLTEIITLHRELKTFLSETPEEHPQLCVFHLQDLIAGYSLFIRRSAVNGKFQCFLKQIAETRGLRIHEFRGFIILSSVTDN